MRVNTLYKLRKPIVLVLAFLAFVYFRTPRHSNSSQQQGLVVLRRSDLSSTNATAVRQSIRAFVGIQVRPP